MLTLNSRIACGEPCDVKCKHLLPGLDLPCGHTPKTLQCHQLQAPETIVCEIMVEVQVPSCKHKVLSRCGDLPLKDDYDCSAICGTLLECGHQCKRPCRQCNAIEGGLIVATNHGQCRGTCLQILCSIFYAYINVSTHATRVIWPGNLSCSSELT